jgi:hypothetical protein
MEYNDVYLFNLEEVKKIQDKNKDKREELDIQISIHINDILHELKLKNISLLGRSAPISQGYQMKQQLIDSGYIKKGKNLLKFVEISTNSEKASINHRVHKELITILI